MAETPGPGDDSDMGMPQQRQLGFSPVHAALQPGMVSEMRERKGSGNILKGST